MELMSTLLFGAFLATLPQTRGMVPTFPHLGEAENITTTHKNDHSSGINISLNLIDPKMINELQSFVKYECNKCEYCIIRKEVIPANRKQDDTSYKILFEEFNKDSSRRKRSLTPNKTRTEAEFKLNKGKNKSKTAVTQYTSEDGKVYAIKVKEMNKQTSNQNDTKSSCELYTVKKSFSCDSSESDLILAATRRKVNKKGKKLNDGNSRFSTGMKQKLKMTVFKKRDIRSDNPHETESFMPSLEELY